MASMSNYLENKLLDHALGTASFTMPTAVYVALFTTDPTDANTGTEVSGPSYARQLLTCDPSASGTTANNTDLIWDAATTAWGTITHGGVYDSLTGGNLLLHGALTVPKIIAIGDVVRFSIGSAVSNFD
jgi:hypothetical protein